MKLWTTSFAVFWWAYLGGSGVTTGHEPLSSIHGSGTTNPSKCYWAVMEQLEVRSKNPIRATYRAVGSTTGIAEFLNQYADAPASDFASGDLPLNASVFQTLTERGISVVQLPVLLGPVTFFHSAPVEKLNLTACLLARIFRREIKEWNHSEIVHHNPEFRDMVDLPPISVARRVYGSSSTYGISNYLHAACPEFWPRELTGDLIDWPDDTEKCQGSGGMVKCIKSKAGVIGYAEAGHGHAEGLNEIELENKFGTWQSSLESAAKGGMEAAVEDDVLPSSPDADFSSVSLLNRDGKYTWPIVLMTYIYVRKDLSFIDSPDEQSLLVAFLESLYDDNYIQQCADQYEFTIPGQPVRDFARQGIRMLQVSENASTWIFEDSTAAITGAQDYVISVKRSRISDIERASLMAQVADLKAENNMLKASLNATSASSGMTDEQQKQLQAALILSALSFTIIMLYMIVSVWRDYWNGSDQKESM